MTAQGRANRSAAKVVAALGLVSNQTIVREDSTI